MELKEYLRIIKKYKTLFLAIVIGVVAVVFSFFYFHPVSFDTFLTLNISHSGTQQTQDFRYDNFYRLQADEKFAETAVEWLKSPRMLADIKKDAGMEKEIKKISAEKRSSQIVAVKFSTSTMESAKKISNNIVKEISQNIQDLNKNQKDEIWFEIIADDPVIEKNVPNYKIIFLASILVGIFLGFWGVMIKYYLE